MKEKLKLTPNVKKLLAILMARIAIPNNGNFSDGIKFLSNKQLIIDAARKAENQIIQMIALLRNAGEPNPYKNFDDEDIAKLILDKINVRKSEAIK